METDPSGRDMAEKDIFEREVRRAKDAAKTAYPPPGYVGGQTINYSRSHEMAGTAAGYATAEQAEPIRTADQEVRLMLQKAINIKETRIHQAQNEQTEAHYLRSLFDALPTKMSHDAAMGLKVLLRNYGNSPY